MYRYRTDIDKHFVMKGRKTKRSGNDSFLIIRYAVTDIHINQSIHFAKNKRKLKLCANINNRQMV